MRLAEIQDAKKSPKIRHLGIIAHRKNWLNSTCPRKMVNFGAKTLQDVWLSPGLVHYMYIFGGSCPLTEFCQLENSLCFQVLRSPIFAALLHGTRAAAVSQTLWCGTRNRVTEFSPRAPPIFGWAAITFGIRPHSSLLLFGRFYIYGPK